MNAPQYSFIRNVSFALFLGATFAAFPVAARADDSTQSVLAKAQALLDAGKNQEVIKVLDPYIATHPRDARAFVTRGDAKSNINDNKGALADYTAAIAIKPDYAYAYATRCETNLELENRDRALEDCNKAIELDSESGIAFKWRGDVYYDAGDYALALADYNKAEGLGENGVLLYAARCNTNRLLDKFEEARVDCNKAISIDAKSSRALWAQGTLLVAVGEYEKAVTDWNQYLPIYNGDDSTGYYYRGYALNELKRYSLAFDDLDKYVKNHTDDGDGYRERARAEAGLARNDAALSDLQAAAAAYRKDNDESAAVKIDAMIANLKAGKPL